MKASSNPPKTANFGFGKGTLVKTIDGVKPIEDIVLGDLVQSHPPGKIPSFRWDHYLPELVVQYRPVIETVSHVKDQVLKQSFVSEVVKDDIIVGIDQCFYSDYPQLDKEWNTPRRWAQKQRAIDQFPPWAAAPWFPIQYLDGDIVAEYFEPQPCSAISRMLLLGELTTLYSLKVKDFNTYFVTNVGAWTLGAP